MVKPPRLLLAIEAATRPVSAALFADGALAADERRLEPSAGHAETLLPLIDALLALAGVGVGDIDAFAVTRGPGSFTSVRIGLATALGLAYPARRPVYALTTLEVLAAEAAAQAAKGGVLPLLDARKGEVYAALFAAGQPLAPPLCATAALTAEAWAQTARDAIAGPILAVGDGATAYRAALDAALGDRLRFPVESLFWPDAAALGRRVLQRLAAGLACEPATPLYLRRPEAVVRLDGDASS
ncbi:MAG: tRNA (adenosine(37)-N6)-threonylcarbamoyltransferase complex dimerization subunit type 1 TsaB [Myxococcales bacterium]|nr:MAG: tRNA (adenosine(37)-N6)-threonylcarbamoyltransferase complex dimerization subunit type 1 TsaB [Myxococcales bacterium]